jgi:hypothetical protein
MWLRATSKVRAWFPAFKELANSEKSEPIHGCAIISIIIPFLSSADRDGAPAGSRGTLSVWPERLGVGDRRKVSVTIPATLFIHWHQNGFISAQTRAALSAF